MSYSMPDTTYNGYNNYNPQQMPNMMSQQYQASMTPNIPQHYSSINDAHTNDWLSSHYPTPNKSYSNIATGSPSVYTDISRLSHHNYDGAGSVMSNMTSKTNNTIYNNQRLIHQACANQASKVANQQASNVNNNMNREQFLTSLSETIKLYEDPTDEEFKTRTFKLMANLVANPKFGELKEEALPLLITFMLKEISKPTTELKMVHRWISSISHFLMVKDYVDIILKMASIENSFLLTVLYNRIDMNVNVNHIVDLKYIRGIISLLSILTQADGKVGSKIRDNAREIGLPNRLLFLMYGNCRDLFMTAESFTQFKQVNFNLIGNLCENSEKTLLNMHKENGIAVLIEILSREVEPNIIHVILKILNLFLKAKTVYGTAIVNSNGINILVKHLELGVKANYKQKTLFAGYVEILCENMSLLSPYIITDKCDLLPAMNAAFRVISFENKIALKHTTAFLLNLSAKSVEAKEFMVNKGCIQIFLNLLAICTNAKMTKPEITTNEREFLEDVTENFLGILVNLSNTKNYTLGNEAIRQCTTDQTVEWFFLSHIDTCRSDNKSRLLLLIIRMISHRPDFVDYIHTLTLKHPKRDFSSDIYCLIRRTVQIYASTANKNELNICGKIIIRGFIILTKLSVHPQILAKVDRYFLDNELLEYTFKHINAVKDIEIIMSILTNLLQLLETKEEVINWISTPLTVHYYETFKSFGDLNLSNKITWIQELIMQKTSFPQYL
uniref:Coatomer subunit gamma n=1 Tax=Rhabditophanes sp. KR3021 TaxID=114890 RepID=A0AC35U461_9BILA